MVNALIRVPPRSNPLMSCVIGSKTKRYEALRIAIHRRPSIPTATADTGLRTFVA